jgi:glycogenin glucosyltransferase
LALTIWRLQNPNARLEQLRRSSLVEIEHLTKDPHPDPPLRALPEHSVLEDEEKPVAHPGLSGGASPQGLAQFGGLDGAAMGIARVDFAQKLESRTTSEKPIQAATEELFFTPQGLSAVSSSSAEKTSSSSTSVSQQTSSSSLVEQASSGSTSASQQNQYGNTAFTLPDFGQENEKTVVENRDEMLSPTQYKGTGDDSKGDGLF